MHWRSSERVMSNFNVFATLCEWEKLPDRLKAIWHAKERVVLLALDWLVELRFFVEQFHVAVVLLSDFYFRYHS